MSTDCEFCGGLGYKEAKDKLAAQAQEIERLCAGIGKVNDAAVDEIRHLREMLKAAQTFLLRLEATSICKKISTTTGHIYTMRKRIEQALKGE